MLNLTPIDRSKLQTGMKVCIKNTRLHYVAFGKVVEISTITDSIRVHVTSLTVPKELQSGIILTKEHPTINEGLSVDEILPFGPSELFLIKEPDILV